MASIVGVNPVTIGFGPDSIFVNVSEDAYAGDAQFTLSVDGMQIGGVQTATASHAQGQQQTFIVNANFGPGSHVLRLNFLNDAYDGTPDTDRNLWLEQVQAAGVINNTALPFFTAGLQTVGFDVPSVDIFGGGFSEVIGLHIAEDAYQGDAQFTVSVDGVQVGGVQTATVLRSSGQSQLFRLLGDFDTGPHSVTVNFLNDSYGGTSDTDRNLYVNRIDRVGISSSVNQGLFTSGPVTFSLDRMLSLIPPILVGNGPDRIVLGISQDSYLANAQFTVSVDGTQVGGVQTASTSHGSNQTQTFAALGSFGAGPHAVAVTFLNDAYGGTAATDRNLWVDSISYAGLTTSVATGLFSNGTTTFNVQGPTEVITGSNITGPLGGRAVLNGTPGNDTIVARGTGNFVSGNGGSDTITGSVAGGDTIVVGTIRSGDFGSPKAPVPLKETIAISGAGNVVTAGDEDVSLSGAASGTVAKLGNGANTVVLDGASNFLDVGTGTNTLAMTGGNATIRISGAYPATSSQFIQPSVDTITLSGERNLVSASISNGKLVVGSAVTINGGTGFGTFDLGSGTATIHTDGPGNMVSFGGGTFDITPGSGSARVSVGGLQFGANGAIHLAGVNNVVRSAGATVAVTGGDGGGTYEFDESITRGGPSSLITSGPGNSVTQRNVEVAMQLGGGGDTVSVFGGKSSVVFNGSGNMLFLQPGQFTYEPGGSTSVQDNSTGLQISLDPGFGTLNVSSFDPTGVFHLLGGIGGFTTPDQVAAAVVYDTSSFNTLLLGSDKVVFTGVHLTADNFAIG